MPSSRSLLQRVALAAVVALSAIVQGHDTAVVVDHGAKMGASGALAPTLRDELVRMQDLYPGLEALTTAALAPGAPALDRRAALEALGAALFYGNDTLAVAPSMVNGTLAMALFDGAAALGSPRGQFHVGVAHSYGLWGYARDEARAMTEYYFAALGGDMGAVMALAHRHLHGIHTPRSCESSARYYEVAANRAVALREAASHHRPAIYDLPHRRLKTVHETQHKKNLPSDAAIVDYYQFSADKGDPEATLNLATLYYYGARGLAQDLSQAARLFHRAHELGASGSAFNLGHMYSHGIGVTQDNATAVKYLQEATQEGSTAAQNALAFMYLHGKGLERDHAQALTLFKAAAKQGSMEAFYNLGVLHMQGVGLGEQRRDPEYEVAHGYFQVAAHQGHTLSSHKLGHMSLHGIGTTRSCKNAVDSFKTVAERGEWDRLLGQAFKDYKRQDYEAAFIKYAVMAQQGYEIAQHNAAYLLDYGFLSPMFSATMTTPSLTAEEAATGAIQLYKLAAMQGNVDANLKIGDFYYYGRGGHPVDFTKASAHYSLASKRANAQAMFNLGLMYEHGIGVQQDFFLAKRYFDKAIDAHNDAKVPVTLALWKLKTHIFLRGWKRWWDEFVGNVQPSTPANATPPTPGQGEESASSESISWTERFSRVMNKLLAGGDPTMDSAPETPRPMPVNGEVAGWSSVLLSDEAIIVLLSVALGVVMYIRSERQHRLGQQDNDGRAPLAAPME